MSDGGGQHLRRTLRIEGDAMDRLQVLRELFNGSEGRRFDIEFSGGDRRDLQIVDGSHVLLNDTVWGVPLSPNGAESGAGPGIQFDLQDVHRVLDFETRVPLFEVS
jgi:hypothetical protein